MSRTRGTRKVWLRPVALAAALAMGTTGAGAATEPRFLLPVECGLGTWTASRIGDPGHSPMWAADLNLPGNADAGAPAVTAAPGIVTKVVVSTTSYGKHVEVDHGGGWTTLYAHLDSITVELNDQVRMGSEIGKIGTTGNSSGEHLHFEQRLSGNDVQPEVDGSVMTNGSYESTNCRRWNHAGHEGDRFTDFNGDGKTDVFRSNGTQWYAAHGGSGAWTELKTSSASTTRLAFGDFNGDGKTDVFKANGVNFEVSYGGTGAWTEIKASTVPISKLAFGDFNGDGKTDVFRANGADWFVSYGGTGAWTQMKTSTMELNDLAFSDFNGDGKTDVFRTNGTNWFVSYGGTGAWTTLNASSVTLRGMGFGDFNGDGKTDVFRTNGTNWYVSYGGTGSWTTLKVSATPLNRLAFGDFNGDRKTDVLRTDGTTWFVSYGGSGAWTELKTSGVTLNQVMLGSRTR